VAKVVMEQLLLSVVLALLTPAVVAGQQIFRQMWVALAGQEEVVLVVFAQTMEQQQPQILAVVVELVVQLVQLVVQEAPA
jgi:hypothetical protein